MGLETKYGGIMDLSETAKLTFEKVIKETLKAKQVKFDKENILWLPKSQIRIEGQYIYLPEWLVKNNSLDSFKIK